MLAITHVRPRALLRVRDLDLPVPHAPDLVIARGTQLVLPNGADVAPGHRMTVRFERVALRLSFVDGDATSFSHALPTEPRVALAIAAAAALHLVVLALFMHGRVPPDSVEADARDAMKQYLAKAEERAARAEAEKAPPMAPPPDGAEAAMAPATNDSRASRGGAGKPSEEGTAGDPSRTKDGARYRITRGTDTRESRPEERALASQFGLLAILGADTSGANAGRSPWAAETGRAAMGNIFGPTIHDAAGQAGLGLSGAGSGGGGLGAGVSMGLNGADGFGGGGDGELGLGRFGTLGHGGGSGTCGANCGAGAHGRLGGTHQVKTFFMRSCGDRERGCVQVNGRLPPEAIQRIVRQNHGRLRACYEQGLHRDPSLEGRVATKFVIDRSGAVSMVSTADSAIADGSVNACIARAFGNMAFPEPEGGIVTVVYPLVFSKE